MAKRTVRKTDPETTTAPERRRRTTATEGIASAAKANRSRRKAGSVAPAMGVEAVETPAELVAHIEEIEFTTAPDAVAAPEVTHEHIAVRAYHIYLSRGARPGDQFADWIAAERELRQQARSAR
jgi:hypothetical protein